MNKQDHLQSQVSRIAFFRRQREKRELKENDKTAERSSDTKEFTEEKNRDQKEVPKR